MAYLKCLRNVSTTSIPDGSTVTPTDDIQTLLNCANIWDKSYTTLTELLSDSTSLQAVISSNNAIDYLVRSTTWATDMCADSTAMSYIGLNNYASNTLLGDSTWCNAIWLSTYRESVLNVKVPVMTSNNTPSGLCACSQRYDASFDAYKAFDGNNTTAWGTGSGNPDNRTLSYTFPNVVKIYGMELLPYYINSNGFLKDFDLVDDNDNVIISKTVPNTADLQSYLFNSPVESAKYQINTTSPNYNGNYDINIYTVQFYGRADV